MIIGRISHLHEEEIKAFQQINKTYYLSINNKFKYKVAFFIRKTPTFRKKVDFLFP